MSGHVRTIAVNDLVGNGCYVEDGQEYRILAYDRKDNVYCFITKGKRTIPLCTELLGQDVTLPRYECRRGYVFKSNTKYPDFTCKTLSEVAKWANENCIERRALPHWWSPDIADVNCRQIHADYDCCDEYYGLSVYHMYMTDRALRKMRGEDQELEYRI